MRDQAPTAGPCRLTAVLAQVQDALGSSGNGEDSGSEGGDGDDVSEDGDFMGQLRRGGKKAKAAEGGKAAPKAKASKAPKKAAGSEDGDDDGEVGISWCCGLGSCMKGASEASTCPSTDTPLVQARNAGARGLET